MLAAFEALDARISAQHSRRCFEPAGQDGVNCLLLAALDQLCDVGLTVDVSATELRELVIVFLVEWKTLVIDSDWKQRSVDRCDDLTHLCDAGSDYDEFLSTSTAVGNHVTLMAICGVLSKRKGERIEGQVGSANPNPDPNPNPNPNPYPNPNPNPNPNPITPT